MEEIKNTAAPADSEQVLVRRQKLADLRAAGCDPFTISPTRRTPAAPPRWPAA